MENINKLTPTEKIKKYGNVIIALIGEKTIYIEVKNNGRYYYYNFKQKDLEFFTKCNYKNINEAFNYLNSLFEKKRYVIENGNLIIVLLNNGIDKKIEIKLIEFGFNLSSEMNELLKENCELKKKVEVLGKKLNEKNDLYFYTNLYGEDSEILKKFEWIKRLNNIKNIDYSKTLIYGERDYDNGYYTGYFNSNGKKEGKGKMIFVDGTIYEGDHINGYASGKGIKIFSDGNKYIGEWSKDKNNGRGTLIYTNGDKYEGEFVEDKFNGKGTYNWKNGDKFEGGFLKNKFEGEGKKTYFDGKVRIGEYKNGQEIGIHIIMKPNYEIQEINY